MADLSLDLCGVKLKNPIIAASGTFGFGREYDELYDIGQLGGISVKGLSLLPRTGNPPSRIAETPSGMLNSVGLQNPGVESFIENDLPWLLTKNVAVIANITGTSVEQYVQMAERLAGPGVQLLEIERREWISERKKMIHLLMRCIYIYREKRRIDVWMRERHLSSMLAAFD